ncbi:hypothetical protein MSKU15_0655 [Komagataeibacter diospyri]|uniref:hypothetical protein n=1 Tax=Komagataeibacter diospyri TaxID=1932662 RepID=UPI001137EB9F|nr:hypothetical protein [Komagataeibacter diospyri]GCE89054.1 hypothetical protein MSKU15_0655 [Komagataeibacter diospyri]
MASGFYTNFKALLGSAQCNLTDTTFKVAAFSGSFVFDPSNVYLSEINANQLGSGIPLQDPAIVDGFLTGTTNDFYDVSNGDVISVLVYYRETGDPKTSPLIGYDDGAAGLPYTSDGTNIKCGWPNNQVLAL